MLCYDMIEEREEMKKNLRRTKENLLTHWTFLCNLQGKFLSSESHLWGFSTSPTLEEHRGYCTSAHTWHPRRTELSDKRLLLFPQAPAKVLGAQTSICITPWREGFRPKEAGSHGFLMSHVLTGLVVSCYRCVQDSLMRCRKFRRPKKLFEFSGYTGRIKTVCVLPGIAKQGICSLSLRKTLPFGVKALMRVDCHKGELKRGWVTSQEWKHRQDRILQWHINYSNIFCNSPAI